MRTEEQIRDELARHLSNRQEMRQEFGRLQAAQAQIAARLRQLQAELIACEGTVKGLLGVLGEVDPDAPQQVPKGGDGDAGW